MTTGNLFRHLLLCSTALLPAGTALAQAPNAAPQGGRVTAGAASIAAGANGTVVTQSSNRAAIEWNRFDVGSQQSVTFQQPSQQSWTLNRVTTPEPSQIAGRIQANGGVAIVNQSGVVFAQGAQVNVGSLIASAANITDQNFMAGRMVFDGAPRPGARVENHGQITVAQQGLVALAGPQVANSGTIRAKLGRVALAGAETYALDLAGDGLLSIDVTQAVRNAPGGGAALVTNSGTIEAQGGSVLLTATAASGLVEDVVRQSGRIDAATRGTRTGQVALRGTGGGVRVSGSVEATGGAGESGGRIEVLAQGGTARVAAGARLDASGGAGGGRVAVGADVASPAGRPARRATRTVVEQGATLRADATGKGAGGTVVVNGEQSVTVRGRLSARGGPQGGDGGLVEVSSGGDLTLSAVVDVAAPKGTNGTLLLDPQSLRVTNDPAPDPPPANPGDPPSNPPADPNASGGTVDAGTVAGTGEVRVTPATIAAFNGTVTLQAETLVTVSDAITKTNGGLNLLTTSATATGVAVDAAVSVTGDFLARTAGTFSLGGGGRVDANRITLSANGLASTASGTFLTAGSVQLLPNAAGAAMGVGGTGSGGLDVATGFLNGIQTGQLVLGGDLGPLGTTAGNLTLLGPTVLPAGRVGSLVLLSGGDIAQLARLETAQLWAVAAGSVALGDPTNAIASLSGASSGVNGFTLATSGGLTVNGTVTTAGGLLSLSAAALSLDPAGGLTGPGGVRLTADRMALGAAVDAGAATLTLNVLTPGNAVRLAGTDPEDRLFLSDGDLSRLTAGALRIGPDAGAIDLAGNVSFRDGAPGFGNARVGILDLSGSSVGQSSGTLNVSRVQGGASGGDFVLDAAGNTLDSAGAIAATGSIRLRSARDLTTAGALSAGDRIWLKSDGALAVTGSAMADQVNLWGGGPVSLAGPVQGTSAVSLVASGDPGNGVTPGVSGASVTQTAAGTVGTASLAIWASDSVRLDAANHVDAAIGQSVLGGFSLRSENALTVGAVPVAIPDPGGSPLTLSPFVSAPASIRLDAPSLTILPGSVATVQTGAGGTVALTADAMDIGGGVTAGGTGTVSLRPRSTGLDMALGDAGTAPGALRLSQAELSLVTGNLLLGSEAGVPGQILARTTAGDIAVSGPVSLAGALELRTRGDIVPGAAISAAGGLAARAGGDIALSLTNGLNGLSDETGTTLRAGGDLTASAAGALTVGKAMVAGGNLALTAGGGVLVGQSLSAGGNLSLSGTSLDLQAPVSAATTDSGNPAAPRLSLTATGGNISQTAAGLLTGHSLAAIAAGGSVGLDQAANAVSRLEAARSGLFGSLAFRAAGDLTVAGDHSQTPPLLAGIGTGNLLRSGGSLTLAGDVTVQDFNFPGFSIPGSLRLEAAGGIAQSAGTLSVSDLTLSAGGGVSLPGPAGGTGNRVARVGGSAGGALSLTDSVALEVGALSAGTSLSLSAPGLTLTDALGAGTAMSLNAASDITQTAGLLTAPQLAVTAGGTVSLPGPAGGAGNAVGQLGGSAGGALSLTGSLPLGVGALSAGTSLSLAAPDIALAGNVTAGTAMSLSAANGIAQTAGLLTAPQLTVSAGGAVSLPGPAGGAGNAVGQVGGSAGGTFLLVNAGALTVGTLTAGGQPAPGETGIDPATPALDLAAPTITLVGNLTGGALGPTLSPRRDVRLQADTLDLSGGTVTALGGGTIRLPPLTGGTAITLGGYVPGTLSILTGNATRLSAGRVLLGSDTAGSITLAGGFNLRGGGAGTVLELRTAGDIAGPGVLDVAGLAAVAGGRIDLGTAAQRIDRIAGTLSDPTVGLQAGGDLRLRQESGIAPALTVAAEVRAGATGTLTLAADDLVLLNDGVTTFARLRAPDGTIVLHPEGTGAGMLLGGAAGSVAAGALSLDATELTLLDGGTVGGGFLPARLLRLGEASGGGITLLGPVTLRDANLGSGTYAVRVGGLELLSGGTVAQVAGGAVDVGAISIQAGAIEMGQGANRVDRIVALTGGTDGLRAEAGNVRFRNAADPWGTPIDLRIEAPVTARSLSTPQGAEVDLQAAGGLDLAANLAVEAQNGDVRLTAGGALGLAAGTLLRAGSPATAGLGGGDIVLRGGTVTLRGTLDAYAGHAGRDILVTATDLPASPATVTLDHGGTAAAGRDLLFQADGGTLRNTGTVTSGQAAAGVAAAGGGNATLRALSGPADNTGLVSANGAVLVEAQGDVSNTGTASGTTGATLRSLAGTATNTSLVSAGTGAALVQAQGDIANTGQVTGGTDATLRSLAGTATTTNLVSATAGTALVEAQGDVSNTGQVSGGTDATLRSLAGTVTNANLVSAAGGAALVQAQGDATNAGTVTGATDATLRSLAGDAANMNLLSAATGTALVAASGLASNSGQVTGVSASVTGGTASNAGTIGGGSATLSAAGDATNTGLLSATGAATVQAIGGSAVNGGTARGATLDVLAGAAIGNTGVLEATAGRATLRAGTTLTNAATGRIGGQLAGPGLSVDAAAGTDLLNQGQILGSHDVALAAGTAPGGGTLENQDTIRAAAGTLSFRVPTGSLILGGSAEGLGVSGTAGNAVTVTGGVDSHDGALGLTAATGPLDISGSTASGTGATTLTATAGTLTIGGIVTGTGITGTAGNAVSVAGYVDSLGGALGLTAATGQIDISGGITSGAGATTLTATTGSLVVSSVTPGASVIGTGITGTAGGSIWIDGYVDSQGGALSLTAATGPLDITGSTTSGAGATTLTATAGSLVVGGSVSGTSITGTAGDSVLVWSTGSVDSQGGALGLTAATGQIDIGGNITSGAGATTFTATAGSLTIGGFVSGTGVTGTAGNAVSVTGSVDSQGGALGLTAATGPLHISGGTASGAGATTLTATAGALTIAGPVTGTGVTGTAGTGLAVTTAGTVAGGTGAVRLAAGGAMALDGPVSGAGADATAGGDLAARAAITSTAALGLTAGGALTHVATLQAAGDAALRAGGDLRSTGTLETGGALTATAGGTLSATGTLRGQGDVALEAGQGLGTAGTVQSLAGNLALHARAGDITQTGGLVSATAAAPGGTVTLLAEAGTFAQTAGRLEARVLDGQLAGGTVLAVTPATAADGVRLGSLGNFAVGGDLEIRVTDPGAPLRVTGLASAGGAMTIASDDLLLPAGGALAAGTTLTLVTETGGLPIQLGGAAGAATAGTLTLDTAELGRITVPVLVVGDALAGGIRIAGDVPLSALRGNGTRAAAALRLATAGDVTQAGGTSLDVIALSGQAGGSILLDSRDAAGAAPNRIDAATNLAAGGDLRIDTGLSAAAADRAGGAFRAGDLAAGPGRGLTLAADDLVLTGPLSVPGGTVTLVPVTPGRPMALGAAAAASGALSLDAAELLLAGQDAATMILGADGGAVAGDMTLSGPLGFGAAQRLSLSSQGSILGSGAAVRVPFLTAAAGGDLRLDGAGNAVTRFGTLSAGTGRTLSLANGGDLRLTGVASAAGGTIRLSAGQAIGQDAGAILVANALEATAGRTVVLDQANAVARLDALSFSTGATLRTAGDLAVAGTVAGSGALRLDAGGALDLRGGSAVRIASAGPGGGIVATAAGDLSSAGTLDGQAIALTAGGALRVTGGALSGGIGGLALRARGGALAVSDAALLSLGSIALDAAGPATLRNASLEARALDAGTAYAPPGGPALAVTAGGAVTVTGATLTSGALLALQAGQGMAVLDSRLLTQPFGAGPEQAATLAAGGDLSLAGTTLSTGGSAGLTAGGDLLLTGGALTADSLALTATGAVAATGTVLAATQGLALAADGDVLLSGVTLAAGTAALGSGGSLALARSALAADGLALSATGRIDATGTRFASTRETSLAAGGGLGLDGSDLDAGTTVRLRAGQAVSLGGVRVSAEVLDLRTTRGSLMLDGVTATIGEAVLFAAPGGIQAGATTTVAPRGLSRLPAVVFDTRTASYPDPLGQVRPDQPGLQPSQQATQVRQPNAQVPGSFGAAGLTPGGDVVLKLEAGSSAVFLLLDTGAASGTVNAGRLGIQGGGGSSDLFGTLRGLGGAQAARAADLTRPTTPASLTRYRINRCVVGSVNCVALPIATLLPARPPERVTIQAENSRLDDGDVVVPNVGEEDY